jgi:putative transposase
MLTFGESGPRSAPTEKAARLWYQVGRRSENCGRICIGKRKINLSRAFAGHLVGIREVADEIWLVSFMEYDLGFFGQDEGHVQPAPNPFIPKVFPISPV